MPNVFVMGLNDFNRTLLARIRGAEEYAFHSLVANELVEEPEHYDVRGILAAAEAELAAFPGSVDAIVGYIDIPVGALLPILCQAHGLPTPTLESVLRCQHKYWARLEQARVVPQHIPRYAGVDPFAPRAAARPPLDYPFWLKPVKSAGSYLGFRIANGRQYRESLAVIRDNIARLAEPFDFLVDYAGVREGPVALDFSQCLAEELIGGRQCTLEGYILQGEVVVYGVLDSIRDRNRSTFLRYQYPSQLPRGVQARMVRIAQRLLPALGLDHTAFNMEFFWDRRRDHVWLLETNTRVSQSHSDLFDLVDGASNHQAMVELGLGRRPAMPHREGPYATAAKFFLRHQADGVVAAVPTAADIERVQAAFPGSRVKINVRPGDRLSELREQDSYSYDLGWVFLGAHSPAALGQAFARARELLPFRIRGVEVRAWAKGD